MELFQKLDYVFDFSYSGVRYIKKKALVVTKRRSKLRHLWVSLCAGWAHKYEVEHSRVPFRHGRTPARREVSGLSCKADSKATSEGHTEIRFHSNWYYLFQNRMFHLTILFDHDCDVTCASLSRLNFTSQSLIQTWLDRILDYRHAICRPKINRV